MEQPWSSRGSALPLPLVQPLSGLQVEIVSAYLGVLARVSIDAVLIVKQTPLGEFCLFLSSSGA